MRLVEALRFTAETATDTESMPCQACGGPLPETNDPELAKALAVLAERVPPQWVIELAKRLIRQEEAGANATIGATFHVRRGYVLGIKPDWGDVYELPAGEKTGRRSA